MFICLPKSSIFTASAYWGFPGRHTLLKILLSAMAGVGVISSVAVFLFLLLASFSAARQERSTRANWEKVTTADQGTYKYLALLTVNGDPKCSGSIPSKWTVLTFSTDAIDPSNTKAYAGVLKVAEAQPTAGGNIQVRDVAKVAEEGGLKICTLNKPWEFNDIVGSIEVSASEQTSCTVLGFGKVGTTEDRFPRKQSVALATDNCDGIGDGVIGSKVAGTAEATEKLDGLDFGGPLVCGGNQRGISKDYKPTNDKQCNLYIDLTPHRTWIQEGIEAAEAAGAAGETGGTGGTGGAGGTGGNGTASSGYSIHSHLNKYSNWKVLWFLVPPIVAFLQY